MNLKLFPQAIILVAVPTIFQLIFVFTLAGLLKQLEGEVAREMRSREVIASADHMTKLLQQSGYALYGFKNTKSADMRERYRTNCLEVDEELERLRPMVAGRFDESRSVESVGEQFAKARTYGEQLIDGIEKGVDFDSTQLVMANRETVLSLSNGILKSLRQLTELERESAKHAKSQSPATRKLIWDCLVIGVVGNIALALFLARLFYKGTTARLNTLVDNTKRMSRGEPLTPSLTGGDELAELDRVFHSMADAVAEANRKERAVIENASDAICSINVNFTFLTANPASLEVFGVPVSELVGKPLSSIVMPEDWQLVVTGLNSSRERQKPVFFDSRIIRADGRRSDIHWSAHWADSEKRFFLVAHDISERKRIETMKQDFVSMISHDLRTPLMSVQADIELLSADSREFPQSVDRLSSAARNLKYVITLITSLLDVERLSADRLEVHLSLTRLQSVFERALDAVLPLSQKKQISVECESTDVIVMADKGRLAQVLINLLSNSLKFSAPNTSVVIRVKEAVEHVEIRVIDKGRGIPQDKLDAVFDRFEQVKPGGGDAESGAGLGLAICKKIIEEHHGTISVSSQEGSGSEFLIRLPA